MSQAKAFVMQPDQMDLLISALAAAGYAVKGPRLADHAIVYGDISQASDLPMGWSDRQDNGSYRLEQRGDKTLFGYNLGQDSWKRFFYPPQEKLFSAAREVKDWRLQEEPEESAPMALLGVRPCELAAIHIQDRVLLQGVYADPFYKARREKSFIVALNCSQAGGTCFCASMGTGPSADNGYDLALTELSDASDHVLIIEQGSLRGGEILAGLDLPPDGNLIKKAREAVNRTEAEMGRALDREGLAGRLMANPEHPHWDVVAGRCLNCGNCTMVCPTCFCCTVQDTQELSGGQAARLRLWDSCFTPDHSYIHGGSIRPSPKSRYRQWLTHKLATWHDQFGTDGCVGCGRCITWCPVGIDLTAEAVVVAGETPGPPNGDR
jgi:sulfhydrogenase subunit beta (sulfur reductase)